jgi:hypothetical protein
VTVYVLMRTPRFCTADVEIVQAIYTSKKACIEETERLAECDRALGYSPQNMRVLKRRLRGAA